MNCKGNIETMRSLILVALLFPSLSSMGITAETNAKVKEGGNAVADAEGIESIGHENGCEVFAVGSGNYHFQVN